MRIIDVHIHGIVGFDTRTESEKHILKIAEIEGRLGVSEILPTVYPSSIRTMRENMHAIKKAMEIQKAEGGRQKSEAKIIGIHLEGPFLNPSRCGALNSGSFIDPTDHNIKKLIEGFDDVVKIITIAPELRGAVDIITEISGKGIIASMGHSDATYAEAEAGFNAGARGITHIFNAMRGVHHREPGLAGFGLMNQEIYIEVIADPFHLDPKFLEFIFSVKNPEKIIIVSDTVKTRKTASASQGIRNKENILLGSSMPISESADRLIKSHLCKASVNKAISENPARYLAING